MPAGFEAIRVETERCPFGLRTVISGPGISVRDVRWSGAGDIWVGITLRQDGIPSDGFLNLDGQGSLRGYRLAPTGPDRVSVYCAELFRRGDGLLWALGAVEEGRREREVFFPIDAGVLPPSLQRFAASTEHLVRVEADPVVRLLLDDFTRKTARIVCDALSGPRRKRKAWKLPVDPYPLGAAVDAAGAIHVVGTNGEGATHWTYDAEGALVGERACTLPEPIGPRALLDAAPDRFRLVEGSAPKDPTVDGPAPALHVATSLGADATRRELFTLPFAGVAFYSIWSPRFLPRGAWFSHFTYGSDAPSRSGNGWMVVAGDRVVAAFCQDPARAGVYRDLDGADHRLDAAGLTLHDLDVDVACQRAVACYSHPAERGTAGHDRVLLSWHDVP